MNTKILVAYATRTGSTEQVAQTIGKTLSQYGNSLEVRPIKEVTDVKPYQSVIIGTAIRYGQIMPEVLKFLEQNRQNLSEKPVAIFTLHLMNMGDDEASCKARQAYLEPVRKLITPKVEAFFPGVGDLSKVNFFERIIAKMVKSPEGDFRNWETIRSWAEGLRQTGIAG